MLAEPATVAYLAIGYFFTYILIYRKTYILGGMAFLALAITGFATAGTDQTMLAVSFIMMMLSIGLMIGDILTISKKNRQSA